MTAPHTHDAGEIAALEAASGLHLLGYLLAGAPGTLVPILSGRQLSEQARRELVARLNGRGVPIVADTPPVEPSKT